MVAAGTIDWFRAIFCRTRSAKLYGPGDFLQLDADNGDTPQSLPTERDAEAQKTIADVLSDQQFAVAALWHHYELPLPAIRRCQLFCTCLPELPSEISIKDMFSESKARQGLWKALFNQEYLLLGAYGSSNLPVEHLLLMRLYIDQGHLSIQYVYGMVTCYMKSQICGTCERVHKVSGTMFSATETLPRWIRQDFDDFVFAPLFTARGRNVELDSQSRYELLQLAGVTSLPNSIVLACIEGSVCFLGQ